MRLDGMAVFVNQALNPERWGAAGKKFQKKVKISPRLTWPKASLLNVVGLPLQSNKGTENAINENSRRGKPENAQNRDLRQELNAKTARKVNPVS